MIYSENLHKNRKLEIEMTKELDDFKLSVERLSEDHTNKVFFNEGQKHAAIVLENILRSAKNTLCIYSGSLAAEVFDEKNLLSIFQDRINEGDLKIHVLVDKFVEEDKKSDTYKFIQANKKIKIYQAPGALRAMLKHIFKDEICHFTVADNSSYRLETNTKEFKAACNFNDPVIGDRLAKIFRHYWAKAAKAAKITGVTSKNMFNI